MRPVLTAALLTFAVIAASTITILQSGCNANSTSHSTLYGKVVLGSDLQDDSSVVHFIVRGPDIYVDRNKDNDPQSDELITNGELPLIRDSSGAATYRIFELRLGVALKVVSESLAQQLGMTVDVGGDFNYEQIGTLLLKPNPDDATWIQFNGPVQLFNNQEGLTLFKGGNPVELQLFAGTIARGPGQQLGTPNQLPAPKNGSQPLTDTDDLRRITYIVPMQNSPVPQARVEFPAADGPIVQEFDLDKFC